MKEIVILEDALIVPGNIKIQWVRLYEGIWGDYDEDNPFDIEYLRFDVYFWDEYELEWRDPGNASYCTLFPVDTTQEQRIKALRIIADEIKDSQDGYKRKLEYMSWIEPSWLEE